jgi:hypothetical protein
MANLRVLIFLLLMGQAHNCSHQEYLNILSPFLLLLKFLLPRFYCFGGLITLNLTIMYIVSRIYQGQ